MQSTTFVGIDVSKATLDVFVLPQRQKLRLANQPDGFAVLTDRLRSTAAGGTVTVAMEATGTLAWPAAQALSAAGFRVAVVNPRRITGFRAAIAREAKTDPLDAELIARFALAMDEEPRPLPDRAILALRAQAARRRQLVQIAADEKKRLKQTLEPAIADSIRNVLAVITAERKRIETELLAAIAADPELARRFALLVSVPGIGPTIAATLLCDMPEIGAIDRRAAAALAGLAPQDRESGKWKGRAAIRGGRPCVRAALYLGAIVAARCNPHLAAFYKRQRANGKPHKLATTAVARKLLVAANTILKTGKPWQQHHNGT